MPEMGDTNRLAHKNVKQRFSIQLILLYLATEPNVNYNLNLIYCGTASHESEAKKKDSLLFSNGI